VCCNKTNVFDDEDLEKWWDEEESDNNGLTIVVAYVADLEWIKQKRVPRGFRGTFVGDICLWLWITR